VPFGGTGGCSATEGSAMLDLLKRNRVLVSACAVLSLLAVLLSLRWSNPSYARWIDEVLHVVAYPFQAAYQKTTSGISGAVLHYVYLVNVKEENDRLKQQVQTLQEEMNQYVNSSIQFNLLREQLGFLEETPERKVWAEVVGASADNFHNILLINKGQQAGIRRNYPVVLRQGVVGRVESVTALQAVVELIVDRRHRFPVLVQRTRDRLQARGSGGELELQAQDRAMAFGQGSGLIVDRIRMLSDIQVGDRVVTSGLEGIFPKGMLVGTITAVGRDKHELFEVAEVKPVVDFSRIEGVFIILKDRRSADYPLFSEP
jgi:rod shape-determining protein MreC